MSDELSDEQLLRYSRHILLPLVDVAGQQAICRSRVLIVGVGGLGSPVALYLAAAGVGALILVDDDTVEVTNLQRQIIHQQSALGQSKVESARQAIDQLNPDVEVVCVTQRLTASGMQTWTSQVDVVIDCSDNFETRQALNKTCYLNKTPLVSGAAIRLEGQLTVFDYRDEQSPCYQCLYDIAGEQGLTCSESGVLGPVVGVIGAAQALEALKLLANFGEPLVGRVHMYDALRAQWREFKLKRDSDCPVCGAQSEAP